MWYIRTIPSILPFPGDKRPSSDNFGCERAEYSLQVPQKCKGMEMWPFWFVIILSKFKVKRGVIMQKFLAYILVLIICGLVSCRSSLSRDEAAKLVEQSIFNAGFVDAQFAPDQYAIEKLVSNGYMELRIIKGIWGSDIPIYIATEKGKQYVIGTQTYPQIIKDARAFRGAIFKAKVKEITEILTDNQTNSAIVKFLIDYQPAEPYYSAFCSTPHWYCEKDNNLPKSGEVRLKKYDKGWRIER